MNKKILLVTGIVTLVALISSVSFALWYLTFQQTNKNILATDCFKMNFIEDTSSNISLDRAYPMSEEEGSKLKPYLFSFENVCTSTISYQINIETTSESTMPERVMKAMLNNQTSKELNSSIETNTTIPNGKKAFKLETGILYPNDKKNYEIRVWMNETTTMEDTDAMNKNFLAKVTVTGSYQNTYREAILNGTDPVLKDNLIPVTIANDGTVKKADISSEWYNYQNKTWANAVITKDSYTMLSESGKVNGTTKNEKSVTFDGVDDYIDLGLENYDFKNEITITLNAKLKNLNYTVLLGSWDNAGGGIYIKDSQICYSYYVNEASKYVGNCGINVDIDKDNSFAFTYNGSHMKFYLNGNLVSELAQSGTLKTAQTPFFIGANPSPNGLHTQFSNIEVKSASIYNRTLSEEEIKRQYQNNEKIESVNGLLTYQNFDKNEYVDKEIIPESNIESYFVWIPRYKYQIFNDGNYPGLTTIENKTQEIKIIFENKNTTPSNGSTVNTWLTHPAFTSFDTNGMWVGKYETGYKGASQKEEAQQNINDTTKIQIKPNMYSWRNIQISYIYLNGFNYQRNLDSHAMKNTEWGAVAYLQHSNYGSKQSVRINNNSNYITGYSALNEPTCGYTGMNEPCNQYGNSSDITLPYNTSTGNLASTTGNVSGIYDMSGGSREYVMGVTLDKTGNPLSGRNSINNSGFNGTFGCPNCDSDISGKTSKTDGINFPEKKYYDTYAYAEDDETYQRRILGDATGEMGPFNIKVYGTQTRQISSWYQNEAWFVPSIMPWLYRGGNHLSGSDTGLFAFTDAYGNASVAGYRIVLAF